MDMRRAGERDEISRTNNLNELTPCLTPCYLGYSLILMTSDMSQFFKISTMRSSSKEMQPPV